jgi:hypothetical protein
MYSTTEMTIPAVVDKPNRMIKDPDGIYFFHIPKTGGTSIYKAIDEAFDSSSICPCWLWGDLIDVPSETLAEYKVFRGHFYGFLEAFVGKKLKTFTILREPVDRTISYYYYIRNHVEHPNHLDALTMSLREFCVHDKTRYLIENYQAGYLASFVSSVDPRTMAERFTAEEKKRHLFQAALEPVTTDIAPSVLLDTALDCLSRFCAVGISEQMDRSMERVSRVIGRTLKTSAKRHNATPDRVSVNQVDAATLQTIEEITAVDRFIYRRIAGRMSMSG